MRRSSKAALACVGAALVGAALIWLSGVGQGGRATGDAPADEVSLVTASVAPAAAASPAPLPAGSDKDRALAAIAGAAARSQQREAQAAAAPAQPELDLAAVDPSVPPEYAKFRANNARYLTDILDPRVKECWDTVKGDGEIVTRHTFLIIDGRAVAGPVQYGDEHGVTVEESTLSEDQDQVALDCLRRAADGTSFPYVPMAEGGDDSAYLAIYEAWPSPVRLARLRAQAAAARR